MALMGFSFGRSRFRYRDFVFKLARSPSELSQFRQLRRRVFCQEQGLFQDDDHDRYDRNMIPIIATTLIAGMEDSVVGVVRIDERGPGVWWGSRLAVDSRFRRLAGVSPSVRIRNRQPESFATWSVGAGLIFKAVSTAHGLGCSRFLAHVQPQNESFFRRLHWASLRKVEVQGRPHIEMQADLAYYPPATHDLRPKEEPAAWLTH